MEQHLKAFGIFLGFALATKLLIVPVAKQMGLPYISDL